jgi:hypothetical protein
VQRRIDAGAGMGAIGDSNRSVQVKAAQALGGEEGAQALDAGASATELGAGLGIGQAMASSPRETMAEPARLVQAGTVECPYCHATIPADSRYCPNCGRQLKSE